MDAPIIVIGAGLGGLSAAIRLAAQGRRVLVLEQNSQVGGKMGEWRQDGFRWDTGPSLITLRPVFDDLFAFAGRRLEDYLDLQPLNPITRCFFADGAQLDLLSEREAMLAQVARLWPGDVDGYAAYLDYVAGLFRLTGPLFIFDQPPRLSSLLRTNPLHALRFDGLRTMDAAIRRYVRSPHLRQMLGMFATYVGASPYRAPATLNVIADVELNQGVWYPRGGVYRMAEAYARLAQELGVEIRTGCKVTQIDVQGGSAGGVRLANGRRLPAQAVVANLDVSLVYEHLLAGEPGAARTAQTLQRREPSCSAFVLLLGVQGQTPGLAHHNEFFSSDYPKEFEQIFGHGQPPDEPTVYVSITSKTTTEDAPEGAENWFIQVNVPALGSFDWANQGEAYAERVLALLARRGYDLRQRIISRRMLTPLDLALDTSAWRGALYGASSNSRMAAFNRPHNRATGVRGVYFTGGSTHPGGGVPMVTLSGKVAADLLVRDGC